MAHPSGLGLGLGLGLGQGAVLAAPALAPVAIAAPAISTGAVVAPGVATGKKFYSPTKPKMFHFKNNKYYFQLDYFRFK